MKQKQLLFLLGLLVVLLGLAYVTGVFDRNASTVDVPDVAIPVDALEQVRIEAPSETIALQRAGAHWQLTEPLEAATDSITVARFMEDLGNLTLASVVSTNPDRYATYGVDSTAKQIAATWPDGMQTVVVGNQGPGFRSVYVRVADDARVFLTGSRLTIPVHLDNWRDKTIMTLPREMVIAVAVQDSAHTFEVAYGTEGWHITQNGTTMPADSAAVARWIQRFASLKANGFNDEFPPADLRESAAKQITFTLITGATETLWLLEQDTDVATTTATADVTYTIRATRLATLLPNPSTLTHE